MTEDEPLLNECLISLAKQCLDNDPRLRPDLATVVTDKLKGLASQSPLAITGKNIFESIKVVEESEAQISVLESCLQNVAVQLEAVLGDIRSNLSQDVKSDTTSLNPTRVAMVEKQLKSIASFIDSSLNQKEIQGGRLAVVYHSSKHKEHNVPITFERSLSGSGTLTSVIRPPINLTFTATFSESILSGLMSPMGVTVSKEGFVYVCDQLGWKAVHIYNPKSKRNKTMVDSASPLEPSSTVPDEKCWHPTGIAVDHGGNILLSDTGSHRVLKFSPEGNLLAIAGKKYSQGEGDGEFNGPSGITVANSGDVYVCDKGNHRIQVLSSELQFIFAFGKHGSGPIEFHHLRDVTFDSAGNIYVVDSSNVCVKVFAPNFEPVRQISSKGKQHMYHHFRAPMNICIDSNDIVYVTDRSKYCVMVFDTTGVFKMSFGNYGKGVYSLFNHPMGIAVDALGHVYVCDKLNGCVQMFV